MNGKQLKNSILQWAIQGRLVPQNPADEPASALLERIRKEKARLVKEGKIKRDKNETIIYRSADNSHYEKSADGTVRCIDDEIPFEIPESWCWCRVKNVIKETNAGKSPNCEKRPKTGNEWGVLTTTAVQYCYFLPNENKVLSPNYTINPEHTVSLEDILITRAGPRNRTGIVCVVDKPCDKLILSDKTVRIEHIRDMINPYYLMYALNSPSIHELVMSATVGMADSQVNISQNSIQNILIPLPPLAEQQCIVAKLEMVLPVVEKYDKAQTELDSLNDSIKDLLKKSILQDAIQGRLVPQIDGEEPASELLKRINKEKQDLLKQGKLKAKDITDSTIFRGDDNRYYEKMGENCKEITDEIPFDIPDCWNWMRFGEYVKMRIGKTPARGCTEYWTSGKYYWVSISDMTDLGIVSSTKEKVSEIAAQREFGDITPTGTLIMSFKLTVGRTSILNISAFHNEAIISIFPYFDEEYIARDYLFYVLPFISNLGDSKDAIKGKTLNSKSLYKMLLPIPPLQEQKRIVNRIKYLYGKL